MKHSKIYIISGIMSIIFFMIIFYGVSTGFDESAMDLISKYNLFGILLLITRAPPMLVSRIYFSISLGEPPSNDILPFLTGITLIAQLLYYFIIGCFGARIIFYKRKKQGSC